MTPATFAALEALAARGACLTMPEPGRLVFRPDDAATAADLEALRPARSWLLTTWQAAAAWDADHPPRPAADPLPPVPGDDADDSEAWGAALALAAAADGAVPFGLTGALRFARSVGARLRWTPAGALALRMPSGHPEAGAVADAMRGHRGALRQLLDLVAADDASGRQRAAIATMPAILATR